MRIGVDFGGTKIEAAVLAPDGRFLARLRAPTPGAYANAVAAVAALVSQAADEAGAPRAAPVGIAIPGSISPSTGLVRNANSTFLNGEAFDRDLAAALGRPIRCANDANCFAVSEAVDGAAAGVSIVFGVILGTGCGGGIAIDGRVHVGAQGLAGEWGHTPLPWPRGEEHPGPACWCGRHGCLEAWISGPAFARWAGAPAPVIADRAAAGDAAALEALRLLADRIARGLAVVVDVLDPDAIVLGGGLSNLAALYPLIETALPPDVFADAYVPRVLPNRHGDSSGVRGAAWLWP